MSKYFSLAEFDETANRIRHQTDVQPRIGMILGSGLGPLAEIGRKRNQDPLP